MPPSTPPPTATATAAPARLVLDGEEAFRIRTEQGDVVVGHEVVEDGGVDVGGIDVPGARREAGDQPVVVECRPPPLTDRRYCRSDRS